MPFGRSWKVTVHAVAVQVLTVPVTAAPFMRKSAAVGTDVNGAWVLVATVTVVVRLTPVSVIRSRVKVAL